MVTKVFKYDGLDSNTEDLLTDFPHMFPSRSTFPMHRVRLDLIPMSPSHCALYVTHLVSSSQKVPHLGASHTYAIYNSCPRGGAWILLFITQLEHTFLIQGQRFSHIHLQ